MNQTTLAYVFDSLKMNWAHENRLFMNQSTLVLLYMFLIHCKEAVQKSQMFMNLTTLGILYDSDELKKDTGS